MLRVKTELEAFKEASAVGHYKSFLPRHELASTIMNGPMLVTERALLLKYHGGQVSSRTFSKMVVTSTMRV